LDGVQHAITLNTTNAFTNAQTIATYVDALVGYDAVWDNSNGVEIKTVQPGRQEETYYEVHNAIGLQLNINTIFGNSNSIRFSRDFFGTSEFTDAYMWLNPDADKPVASSTQVVDWNGGDSTFMNLESNIGTYQVINNATTNQYFVNILRIDPEPQSMDVPYIVRHYKNGEVVYEKEQVGTSLTTIPLQDVEGTFQVYHSVTASEDFYYTALYGQNYWLNGVVTYYETSASINNTETIYKVSPQFPKLKIID